MVKGVCGSPAAALVRLGGAGVNDPRSLVMYLDAVPPPGYVAGGRLTWARGRGAFCAGVRPAEIYFAARLRLVRARQKRNRAAAAVAPPGAYLTGFAAVL